MEYARGTAPLMMTQRCMRSAQRAVSCAAFDSLRAWVQGEIINDSGTMTGGGGKARGGRMRLGSGAPKPLDTAAAAAELAAAEKKEGASLKVPRC